MPRPAFPTLDHAPRDALGAGVLVGLLVLLLAAYGALGRDVFFNHLAHAEAARDDPVAPLLPYLRAGLGALACLIVAAVLGTERALAAAPLALAPFCLLSLASVAWSVDPKGTLRDAATLTVLWLALPMLVHALGLATALRAVLHLVAAVLVASAALAILLPEVGRHSGAEFIQFSHAGRWRGLFGHKNGLGPWAAVGAVFLLTHGRFLGGPPAYRWLAWASALACLAFAGSATALALAAALLGGWLAVVSLRRLAIGPAAVAALVVLGATALATWTLGESLLDLAGRGDTLSGRTALWALAAERFDESPWLGHGYGRGGGEAFLAQAAALFGQAVTGPESGYLSVALDLGLAGCALLVVAYLSALRLGLARLTSAEGEERAALEFALPLALAMPVAAATETGAVLCTGSYGLLAFTALLALATPGEGDGADVSAPRTGP
jgi:exopolysaccharide production protein ExoQ